MADLSSSLTVQFGQPVASHNLSLSGGDESAPAVYHYKRVKVSVSRQVPGTFGMIYQNTTTEHIEGMGSTPGRAEIKLAYDGPEAVRLEIIRGSGLISRGDWRTEWNETVVRFAGQNTLAVESHDPPIVLYTSEFRDEVGNLVDAPTWNETIKAFQHEQVVYGAFIIQTSSRFRLYTVSYNIDDYSMATNSDGQAEVHISAAEGYTSHAVSSGTTLTPMVVAAITNKNFAILSISRSVDARDETVELTQGQKVEVSREGFVDRVFPTPPTSNPKPSRDPVTGRTDYMDVERTTRIMYSTQYCDQNGVVMATYYHSDSQNNPPPDNSYARYMFNRSGKDTAYTQLIADNLQPYYQG